jgi:hypothetical protein
MDRTSDLVQPPKSSPGKIVALIFMLAIGVGILDVAMTTTEALNRDFSEYWAVGQQLVHRRNPYDSMAIVSVLQAAGSKVTPQTHMILRNPPSALFITLPLGFVGVRAAAVLWCMALTAALMASIRMLWTLHGRPRDSLHLVGYMFAPCLACMLAGQLGLFLLFGVTLFLYFNESKPYVAGAAFLLCALKPHLFLPFGVALIAWIVVRKVYQVLIGAVAALLVSTALILCLDPLVWTQYVHGEKSENIQNLFIPCVSVLFRVLVHPNALWLQFLPAFAGCVWGGWYFWTRRDQWNWVEHGSILLLVSILVAPYAWFTDEAIVLPAILAGLYKASNAGRSLLPFGCIAGVALIEVLAGVTLPSGFYLWTAPAWLVWYLYAVRKSANESPAPLKPSADNEQVPARIG